MVRINTVPVNLSFLVYLISHIFAQGNYILLILYSRGPQVNSQLYSWIFPWILKHEHDPGHFLPPILLAGRLLTHTETIF